MPPGPPGRVCVGVRRVSAAVAGRRAGGAAGVCGGDRGHRTQSSDAVPRAVPQPARVPGGPGRLSGSVTIARVGLAQEEERVALSVEEVSLGETPPPDRS